MQFRATIIGFLLGCLGAGLLMLATPAQLDMLMEWLVDPATGQPLLNLDSMALKYLLMGLSITLLPLLALTLASLFRRPEAQEELEAADLYDPIHRFTNYPQDFAAASGQEYPAPTSLVKEPVPEALPTVDAAAASAPAPVPSPSPAPAPATVQSEAQALLESRLFAIAEHIDQLMAITQKNREDIAMVLRQLGGIAQAPAASAPDVQAALHNLTQRLETLEQSQQPLHARSEKMEQWLAHLVQNSTRIAEPPQPMRPVPAMTSAPSLTDPATAERLALALEQLRRVTDGSANG